MGSRISDQRSGIASRPIISPQHLHLSVGTRLGPYEIASPLGAGGMGEVYRARDTQLNRNVAIKVLPELFALDAERLARFTREAQTLGALNHPNIAQIYGLESSAGSTRALVMELVEGEDLSVIIARGPIPLDDALPIARQIVDALEAAHELGIIHRDLKPANIKVRHDGTVKVLDFGLAKAMDPAGSSSADALQSPTLTARATQMGLIIGTAAYMPPEQAKGKAVDKRADIWSFGVVLYEMLTGRRAFGGDDISDVLAAVLRQEIDWAPLPPDTPPRLRRLLERCLERDPKSRLRDIGEARVELAKIEPGAPDIAQGPASSGVAPRRRIREAIAWGVAGAAIVTSGAVVVIYVQRANAPSSPVVRLAFVPPGGLTFDSGLADVVTISPDGRLVAFTGRSTDGKRQLYVRPLAGTEARLLPGTEDPVKPFWSPDSRSIGFGAQGKLKRVEIGGGAPTTLADAARLNGGAWNSSGVILFVADYNSGIMQVSDKGGAVKKVTEPVVAAQETFHRDPAFLPDGRHFLFVGGRTASPQIRLGSVDGSGAKTLLDGAFARFVGPDHLLIERSGTLFAISFDTGRLELTGDPVPVIQPSDMSENAPIGDLRFSVSDNGILVWKHAWAPDCQLLWFDRQGRSIGTVGSPLRLAVTMAPRLSPDGTRVVIQNRLADDNRRGIWVVDLERDLPTRLTSNFGQYPQWSPDGRQVAWIQGVDGVIGIYKKAATGLGNLELLVKSGTGAGGTTFPNDWSRDGRFLLYHARGEKTRVDVWAAPLFGDRKPHPVLNTEFDEGQAQLSSDGRWLAYRSDASGTYEIYVQSFTTTGQAGSERVRISTTGGSQPRFRPDGRELFYLSADSRLMAVAITTTGASFTHDDPKALFRTRTLPPGTEAQFEYDVSRDGQRFLIGTVLDGPHAAPPPPTIVLNWSGELKR